MVHCDIVNIGFIVKKIMKIRLPCEKIINDVPVERLFKKTPEGGLQRSGEKDALEKPLNPL